MTPFIIDKFIVSDYLLVKRLLDSELLSTKEQGKILSTRIPNQVCNVRKIIGNHNCIENIKVKTTFSFYDKYKMNVEYKEHFQQLKKQYEKNVEFMQKVYKKLEKKRGFKS